MNAYLMALQKYAVFEGRSTRTEYWIFFLLNFVFAVAATFLDVFFALYQDSLGIGLLGGLYTLVLLVPSLSVAVRRLHDTGRSGWWFLVVFVPLIGGLLLLILLALKGEEVDNRFGPASSFSMT